MRVHGGGFAIVLDEPSTDNDNRQKSATAYWFDGKPQRTRLKLVSMDPRHKLAFRLQLDEFDVVNRELFLAFLQSGDEGKPYSRIGPKAPANLWDTLGGEIDWLALGRCLTDFNGGAAKPDAEHIPAAYTYFGQFIAHELSNISVLSADEQELESVTASFDLQSLFAGLPAGVATGPVWRGGVGVGPTAAMVIAPPPTPSQIYHDLPRNGIGVAHIADGRNDHNLGVAQIHVAVSRFYQQQGKMAPGNESLARTRTLRCIQEVVLFDFLNRISDPETYCDIMCNGRKLIRPGAFDFGTPLLIPIEFSAACFRIGHSLVRDRYESWHYDGHPASLLDLQHETNLGGGIGVTNPRLRYEWTANWRNLLGDVESPNTVLNHAKAIDQFLNSDFATIPKTPWFSTAVHDYEPYDTLNLAAVTLRRGVEYELPSAQQLSTAYSGLGLPVLLPTLSPMQLMDNRVLDAADPSGLRAFITANDLASRTPLWLYCLLEAKYCHDGQRLGPFATRIVAETIHASLEASGSGIIINGYVADFDREQCCPTRDMCSLYDVVQVSNNWTT